MGFSLTQYIIQPKSYSILHVGEVQVAL